MRTLFHTDSENHLWVMFLTLQPCVLRDTQLHLKRKLVPPYLLLEPFKGWPLLDSIATAGTQEGGKLLLSNGGAPHPTRLLVLTLTLEAGIL